MFRRFPPDLFVSVDKELFVSSEKPKRAKSDKQINKILLEASGNRIDQICSSDNVEVDIEVDDDFRPSSRALSFFGSLSGIISRNGYF